MRDDFRKVYILLYQQISVGSLRAIWEKSLKIDRLTYEILQIPSLSLHDKLPEIELLANTDYKMANELNCIQQLKSLF